MVDDSLTRDIVPTDEFVVATGGNIDVPGNWNFIPNPGWDVSAATLVYADSNLVLSNIAYSPLAPMTWIGGAGAGTWATAVKWDPEGPPSGGSGALVDTAGAEITVDANAATGSLEITQGTVDVQAILAVGNWVRIGPGGALNVAGEVAATSLESAGTLTVQPGAAVAIDGLTITGGTLDTGDNAIVVSGTLRAPGVVVTSDAESFQAMGSGQPGEITVAIIEEDSTLALANPAGAGATLNAPNAHIDVAVPSATLDVDADTAVLGDLSFRGTQLSGLDVIGATTASFRNLSGEGKLKIRLEGGTAGLCEVRGRIDPGNGIGELDLSCDAALTAGASLAPEVQGDQSDLLYVLDNLDLDAPDDALAPSWLPGGDASSMFGGDYVVVDAYETFGEFDIRGGGNIGAAYIADVQYNVDLGTGGWLIVLTLYDQLAGDVDLDGSVEAGDYLALKRHIASTAGAVWGDGDFDFDGDVDRLDFLALRGAFGETVGGPAAAPAPEPTAVLLLGLGASVLLGRRRRQRRRRH